MGQAPPPVKASKKDKKPPSASSSKKATPAVLDLIDLGGMPSSTPHPETVGVQSAGCRVGGFRREALRFEL